jgi:Recombinase zinc beta ribbon domain
MRLNAVGCALGLGGALRAGKTPVSVKAGNTIQSMLAGLARCPPCHGAMLRVTKSKTYRYLVCSKARAGAGCTYHAVKQDAVEDTLRHHAEQIIGEALMATTDAASVTLMATLENVEAGLSATEDQMTRSSVSWRGDLLWRSGSVSGSRRPWRGR